MMRTGLTIFALICFLKVVIAQQVQILPPQVDNFGCTSISDLYSVTINNFESSTIEASMTLEIRYTGNSLQQGIVANGSLSAAPVFLLPAGNTNINSGNIDQFFPERDLVFLDPTLSTLNEQSACLPPGEYEVCIGLYRANTAGNPSPDNLISQTCYTRAKTSANNIFLVSPFNGEILSQPLPILTWTPVANFGAKSNYLLQIVEVFNYQTPYEAFRTNPLFYSQQGLTVNSLQYPMIARPFESCKRYAWRVGYYENDIFNNPGFTEPIIPDVLSEIWLFDTACNEIVGNDPSSFLPPNLLSPQNPVNCSQHGATLFMWSEANVSSNIVRYQLRIVQQDRVGEYNDILFSNEPLFISEMTNEPFYYLQNSSNYLGELPCIWGVIPFDENNQPLFENKALDAAPIYCGQFFSSGDDDCPLDVDQASLISKSYNTANDQWIIELSNPVTNEAALLSETSSIEINGVSIDVSPNISDWTTTITNSISWSSEIMNQSSETLTLALNREVNSSYGMQTNASNSDLVEVGDVLNLTIEKTIDQKDLSLSILDSHGTILSKVCCGGVLDDVEDDMPTQLKVSNNDWTIDIGALRLDKYQEYEVRLEYRGSINAFRIQPTGQKNGNSLRVMASENNTLKLSDNSGKPIRSVSNIEASNAEDGTRDNPDDRRLIRQKLKDKNVKLNRSGKQSYDVYYESYLFSHNDDDSVTEVVKVCLSKTFSSPTENCTGETCISVPLVDNTKDLDEGEDELPKLTKFEVIAGFPKLEPDKSILIKFDIEDDAAAFPDKFIEYKPLEFDFTDDGGILEISEENTNTHTYRLLPRDAVTLELMDLEDLYRDIELPSISAGFEYKILEREEAEPFQLIELRDTLIELTLPIFEDLCDLEITKFEQFGEAQFVQNINTIDGQEISDCFLLDFSIDTRETPNRPDLYQQNHRIEFTINSSSFPITIEPIKVAGRDQKHALEPDWGTIPPEQRDMESILFDITACLKIDFNNIDGVTDCTQERCIEILNEGNLNLQEIACPFEIPKFEVFSKEFIPNSMNIMDHPDTEVSEFYFYEFDYGLDGLDLPVGFSVNNYVSFNTETSNIPLNFYNLGQDYAWAIAPQWESLDYDLNEPEVFYEVTACLTSELIGPGEIIECLDTKCISLFEESEISTSQNYNQNPCPLEIPKFEVFSKEFIPSSMNTMDHPDTEVSEFYFYEFDYGLDDLDLPDGFSVNNYVSFNTETSNIPLKFYNLGQDYAWAIAPQWELLDYDLDEPEVFYEVTACFSSEIIGPGEIIECLDTKCISLFESSNNSIQDEAVCDVQIDTFKVKENYQIYGSGPAIIYQDNEGGMGSNYFFYDFEVDFSNIESCLVDIWGINFESVNSNIPLTFQKVSNNDYEYGVIPNWNIGNELGVDSDDKIWFEVLACLDYGITTIANDAEPSTYVEKDTCIILNHGEFVPASNLPNFLAPDIDCEIEIEYTYETIGNEVILKPTITPFNPNEEYQLTWKLEEGAILDLTDPVGDFTISSIDTPEDQRLEYIVDFETVAGQDLILEVSISGEPCISSYSSKIRNIPNCDKTQCDFVINNNQSTLTTNDEIELCGDLFIDISTLTSSQANNLSGTGAVYIPWLLTKVEVEFQGIKLNNSLQLIDGEVLGVYDDGISGLNLNGLINDLEETFDRDDIIKISKYLTDNPAEKIIKLKEDIENIDLNNTIKLPLGFNNMPVGDNGNALTIAISGLKFEPHQNYIKATAAIEFFDSGDDGNTDFYLAFDSDNFFFNSSKPIFNLGNSVDFKFKLTDDVSFQYYDTESLSITFKAPDENDEGGTGIVFTSECNEPYDWCIDVDSEIDIPSDWLRPVDNNIDKVRGLFFGQLCNFTDFLMEGSLSCPAEIPGTNGTEIEIANVTWDHSNLNNPVGLKFPEEYESPPVDSTFQGLFIKEVSAKLPEALTTFDSGDRITASLKNLIIEKGYGFTVDAEVSPILSIPEMNVADLGASLDTFKLSIIQNIFHEAYLTGFITLPVADYDENNSDTYDNKVIYKALFGDVDNDNSNEFQFFLRPENAIQADLLAGANLQLFETSKFIVTLDSDLVSFDLKMNGVLDFPDGNVYDPENERDWGFSLDAGFEELTVGYTKNFGDEKGIPTFDQGNWTFDGIADFATNHLLDETNYSEGNPFNGDTESETPPELSSFSDDDDENGLEGYKFTLENFNLATGNAEGSEELLVGGIGFDAVINLKDKVGGSAGLELLGRIYKPTNSRLRVGFKELRVSEIGVFANLSGAKLDGYINFIDEPPYGRAVQGGVNAVFKGADVSVSADLLFGRTLDSHPQGSFRYMKAEALATFPDPGVPLAPGFVFRGFGVGFYSNMNADFPDLEQLSNTEYSSAFSGVTFTPDTDTSWGLGLFAMAATSPKEKTFNMDLSLIADFSSSGGISNLVLNAKAFGGTLINERYTSDPWLTGFLVGSLNFPEKKFSLNAGVNISLDPFISTPNPVGLNMYLDGLNNKFHFAFGQPTTNGANTVTFMDGIDARMYLMFGNEGVEKATGWIGPETADMMETFTGSRLFNAEDPNEDKFEDIIHTGKGFSTGLSVEGRSSGTKWGVDYDIGAGGEFHLSMLDYGQDVFCGDHSPIGFNGYYMNATLGVWAAARVGTGGTPLVSIAAAGNLHAEFPKPWKLSGAVGGEIRLLDSDNLELNFNYDFEIGEDCDIEQVTNPENYVIHDIEDVTDDLFIFRDVFIENGAENVDPEKPLRWTTYFDNGEIFTLPQMQQDGTVKSRKFKVEWMPRLLEKGEVIIGVDNAGGLMIQTQFYQLPRRKLDYGININGHWCLSKEVEKYGMPIDVNLEAESNPNNFETWIRENNLSYIRTGKFNNDEFEDILVFSDVSYEWILFLSDGSRFYRTDTELSFLNYEIGLGSSSIRSSYAIHLGYYDSDDLIDILYLDNSDNYKIAFNQGFQGNEIVFTQSDIVHTPTVMDGVQFSGQLVDPITNVGDFNNDGFDDLLFEFEGCNQWYYDGGGKGPNFATYNRQCGTHLKVKINNQINGFGDSEEWYSSGTIETQPNPFSTNANALVFLKSVVKDLDNDGDDDVMYVGRFPQINRTYLTDESPNGDGIFSLQDQYNTYISDYLNSIDQLGGGNENAIAQDINSDFAEDALLFNVQEPYFDCGSDLYPNYLTPNTEYKLELTGNISEWMEDEDEWDVKITDNIYREFKTGNSEEILELIDLYKKDETYFDPTYIPPTSTTISSIPGSINLDGLNPNIQNVAIPTAIKGEVEPSIQSGQPSSGGEVNPIVNPYYFAPLIMVSRDNLNPIKLRKI